MKKFFAVILASMLAISACSFSVFAESTTEEKYDIPKAAVAPVIDGKMDGDEWNNALARSLSTANTTDVIGSGLVMQGATFYWMWDDAGTYVFADVKDNTAPPDRHSAGAGSYNSCDGIQLCVYADKTIEPAENGKLFFFSLIPTTKEGTPAIGEHFVFGDGATGKDVTEAKIASVMNDTGYTIEAFIPTSAWAKSTPPVEIKEGYALALANIVMESDPTLQSLFTDTAWFSGPKSNTYTLTNTVAGHVEAVVEDVPATEPNAEAPVNAAQTSDSVAALAGLAVLAAGVVVFMKKKCK